jgi:single-stranded DNA-binding protein
VLPIHAAFCLQEERAGPKTKEGGRRSSCPSARRSDPPLGSRINWRSVATSGVIERREWDRRDCSGGWSSSLRLVATAFVGIGEGVGEKTNSFTVEVYGGRVPVPDSWVPGSRVVVVDAGLDWREWTDEQGKRRLAVTFRARQALFEGCVLERATASGRRARRLTRSDRRARRTDRAGRRASQRRRPAVLNERVTCAPERRPTAAVAGREQ